MADLISRAAAIDAMRECWRRVHKFAKPFEANRIMDCIEAVKDLPDVDAVPVVRCRDCKWFDCKNYVCNNDILAGRIADCGCYPNFNVELDWFCADGERREDTNA